MHLPIILKRPPVAGTGFSNNFTTGNNGDALANEPGGWTQNAGTFTKDDNVGTWTRAMRTTNAAFVSAWRSSGLFDGTFSLRMHITATNQYNQLGTRRLSSGAGGVYLVAHGAANKWKIQIYDTSDVLQLDYDTGVSFTDVPDTTYDVQLVLSGTSVIAKVNGSQVGATQTDSWSNSSTSTYASFGTNGNGSLSGYFETISATP